MQYSPKLKTAMQEIKAVLDKHDIAGTVVIHTPGFSEYLTKITPSYSCAQNDSNGIRIRATKEQYGSEEKRNQMLSDTTNMLHHLSAETGRNAMQLIEVSKQLDKIVKAIHSGPGSSSHQSQNN